MAKKQYWNSEVKNERWIKEGRGQGVGNNYKPWFSVRDVASEGRSHRVYGHLTNRTHHLLSDLELATFLLLQWRPTTTDIREQFPLDPTYTKQITVRLHQIDDLKDLEQLSIIRLHCNSFYAYSLVETVCLRISSVDIRDFYRTLRQMKACLYRSFDNHKHSRFLTKIA